MAYMRNTIIARPAYSGVGALESELGGLWDSIKDAASAVVKTYGEGKSAQGAAAALATQQQANATIQADSGISTTTIAVLGAVGIGAFLLLRKKK